MQPILTYIALSMGVAWASGINLYAALLVLGLLGSSGNLPLPETLEILQHPLVIGAAGFMYCVEFLVDKVPGVDTVWDALHTFIRIPAGAVLAAAAVGDVDASIVFAAALVGGGLTAGTHLTKASSRILVNTSPEPFSNIAISLSEDVLVVGGLWAALHYPLLFLFLLAIFFFLMIWLLPILWRGSRNLYTTLRKVFKFEQSGRLTDQ